jgi:GTPase SAR1 family protein
MLSPNDIKSLQRDALAWAQRAAALGWLNFGQVAQFATLEQESPDTLFEGATRRPLVVAFFGGTGVGKSTLLNRLAGQEVARTGVVRPTSREISVYLHESVRLKPLPAHLPVDRVQMVYHRSEAYRDVLWVDMPDFDSTDHSNHELAIKWLPHIDVLIYVVSPERYRDDRGWRMLLQQRSQETRQWPAVPQRRRSRFP